MRANSSRTRSAATSGTLSPNQLPAVAQESSTGPFHSRSAVQEALGWLAFQRGQYRAAVGYFAATWQAA